MEISEHPHCEKLTKILHLMSTTGKSTALEVVDSKNDYRLINTLEESGFVEKKLITVLRSVRICLIRLSTRGEKYCRASGWKIIESEWSQMVRLHQTGNGSEKHTAAVLWFAYHARRRGWDIEILPNFDHSFAQPDLLLKKKNQIILGEVETKVRARYGKWRAVGKLAAERNCTLGICGLTPSSRAGLSEECRRIGISGMATDLHSISRGGNDTLLWLQDWH